MEQDRYLGVVHDGRLENTVELAHRRVIERERAHRGRIPRAQPGRASRHELRAAEQLNAIIGFAELPADARRGPDGGGAAPRLRRRDPQLEHAPASRRSMMSSTTRRAGRSPAALGDHLRHASVPARLRAGESAGQRPRVRAGEVTLWAPRTGARNIEVRIATRAAAQPQAGRDAMAGLRLESAVGSRTVVSLGLPGCAVQTRGRPANSYLNC